MSTKTRYLKLPADLYDGETSILHGVDDDPTDLGLYLLQWLEEAAEGETIEISWVELTDDDLASIPEV